MKEILLTSSALILALLILRRVFRNRISRRAQYALWLLVLARLLIPVSLPGVDFSLLTAAEPVSQAVTERLEGQMVYALPTEVYHDSDQPSAAERPAAGNFGITDDSMDSFDRTWHSNVAPDGTVQSEYYSGGVIVDGDQSTRYFFMVPISELLTALWLAGIAGMAAWLLLTNLHFWRNLRKARIPYTIEGCKYPVYLVESGLPSPCLFGLVRPAIYLTPAAAATPERLRHVIAHESAHARHGDPLWALLRGVCLTVWWFNPLVWVASAVSRADGELACDEAALAALGPTERLPYGKTLLALIPVGRSPGDPMLSATTMTAGKRRLKDRITRIAEHRQTRSAALMAVLALAAMACTVTFTGAKGDGMDTGETVPLTGDELAYFNEEFFNNDTVNHVVGVNLHNQFLTSNYARPEDIDLYSLFYCGTGHSAEMTDEELRQVGSFDSNGAQICPTDKLAVADLDAVLLENTGLTLSQTAGIGLEQFQYLPEYDAYYHTHGDTNYLHNIYVAAGERTGNTLQLYYTQTGGWSCVTLEEQSDGSYWFVSNQPAEKPAIPTVYPEGEPVLTISLADLTPNELEPVTVTHRQNDCAERGYGIRITTRGGEEHSFRPYRSTDGNIYAARILSSAVDPDGMLVWDVETFFTYPAGTDVDRLSLESFSLFGQTGVVVSYEGEVTPNHYSTIRDYYAVADDGTVSLLLRTYGTASVIDLDGDGTDELCAASDSTAQVFFQRDGKPYEADIGALLDQAWPEASYREFNWWDVSRRNLSLWASVPLDREADVSGTAFRWVYFDGEHLLVYKDGTTYTDHVADGIDAPEAIVSAARDRVLERLDWWQTHTGRQTYVNGVWADVGTPAEWDDWRITSLELTDEAPAYPQLGVKVYSYSYELHTATPALVTTAGGMYMAEDGWVGGMNSDNLLVFHTMTNSGPTLLESDFPTDVGRSSDSPVFAACLARILVQNGLLTPSQVRAVDLYYMFSENQSTFLNLLGTYDAREQTRAFQALADYADAIAGQDDADLLDYGLQNLARNDSALTDVGRAAYGRLLDTVNGQVLTNARLGLSLRVPAAWDDLAVVAADEPSPAVFSLYERSAHESILGNGLVWSLSAYTLEEFDRLWPGADGSEIFIASSYLIGSDDHYRYLLSTPTDVQFLEDDPDSRAAYEALVEQSQNVLENFLLRNHITPNPLCPNADGRYCCSAAP